MNSFKRFFSIALSMSAVITLTACGGGGSESSSNSNNKFDSTEFQGTWKRNDGTASGNPANCYSFDTYGGTYGGLNRAFVITDTTITNTVEVYSDKTCATYLGLFVETGSVSWSAGALTGKSNVAKALITVTGFSIQRDGAAGYSLPKAPVTGEVIKTLFDVNGTLLYIGDSRSTPDADGYPTVLDTSALYTR